MYEAHLHGWTGTAHLITPCGCRSSPQVPVSRSRPLAQVLHKSQRVLERACLHACSIDHCGERSKNSTNFTTRSSLKTQGSARAKMACEIKIACCSMHHHPSIARITRVCRWSATAKQKRAIRYSCLPHRNCLQSRSERQR